MITAHTFYDRFDGVSWITYKSTFNNAVPMGFEYEIVKDEQGNAPKLPDSYKVHWESIHYADNGEQKSSYGYEIKSPVAPLHYHKYLLRRHRFDKINYNTDPKNMGGIHVNVSRSIYRGRERRDKITEWLASNYDTMCQLSGRQEHHFRKYAQVDVQDNHYYHILSCRKSFAYELRMFHAQPHLLLPALEFTDSAFMLAKKDGAITMDKWIKFINRWPRYRSIAQHVRSTLCPRYTLPSRKGAMVDASVSSVSSSLTQQPLAA
jgi:hypothetical protein